MKKSLLIICISLIGGIGFANTQKGIVKTKGRLNTDQTITKGVPLPDAFVTVQGAQTVSSNKKGLFSVTLTSKDYMYCAMQISSLAHMHILQIPCISSWRLRLSRWKTKSLLSVNYGGHFNGS